jgi:hypothetical protein
LLLVTLLIVDVVECYAFDCSDQQVIFVVDVIGKLLDWNEASFDYSPLATKLSVNGTFTRKMFPALLRLLVEFFLIPLL